MTPEALYADLKRRVATLEREVQTLREWRHDMHGELITPIQDELQGMRESIDRGFQEIARRPPAALDHEEQRKLTMRDVYVAVGSIGAAYAVLHVLGKL